MKTKLLIAKNKIIVLLGPLLPECMYQMSRNLLLESSGLMCRYLIVVSMLSWPSVC